MKRSLAVLALLVGTALAQDATVPKDVAARSLGKFKVTYYWVACEADAKGERDTELLDPAGRSLGKFRAEFAKRLKMEGTGRTLEGKTLNFAGKDRYQFTKHPWGTGAKAAPLAPFRTLAVDPKVIAIGTKVFIPQAAGAELPDGTIHDGVFVAGDTGGAIKGQHVDLFCGLKRDASIFQKRGIDTCELYLLEKDDRKPRPPLKLPRKGVIRFTCAARVAPDPDAAAAATLDESKEVKVLARDGAWLALAKDRWIEAAAVDLR